MARALDHHFACRLLTRRFQQIIRIRLANAHKLVQRLHRFLDLSGFLPGRKHGIQVNHICRTRLPVAEVFLVQGDTPGSRTQYRVISRTPETIRQQGMHHRMSFTGCYMGACQSQ